MESSKARPAACTGKFRFFPCFKPEFPDDSVLPRRKAKNTDPSLAYIVVPEKQRVVLPRVLSSVFAAVKGEENASRRKMIDKDNNNSLRRALMSALNHTPLAKKINNKKKTKKDCFSRENTINLSQITSSSSSLLGFTPCSLSSSTTSTCLSTTSTGSSSESCLSRSLAMNRNRVAIQKQNIGDNIKGYFGSNMCVSLLLITSLLVLIMWGKCCAIAYTSIGFFVVPNRWRRPCKEGAICKELVPFGDQ